MGTTFVAETYIAGLQTLLDRQGVAATVCGLRQDSDRSRGDSPFVELQVDRFDISQNGLVRSIDGVLHATLLVAAPKIAATSELEAFQLALDVATSLQDEQEEGAAPVFAGGPILVTSIEPEVLDGAAGERLSCWAVTYEQQLRITRTNLPAENGQLTWLYVGAEPNVGPDHFPDDYTELEV